MQTSAHSSPKRRKPRTVGPALPAPTCSGLLLVRVAPARVGMFRFLLEGYDNLAYFTVLERQTALLKLVFSPHREYYVRVALVQMAETMALSVEEWPV